MNQQIPPARNPYAPPPTPGYGQGVGHSPYAACPNCNMAAAAPITWTIWGGFIGPKLLTHVRCQQCGNKYNGKTGKSNMTAIVMYNVIIGGIAFLLVGAAVTVIIVAAISG